MLLYFSISDLHLELWMIVFSGCHFFPFLRCRVLKFCWKRQLSKHFQRNLLNLSKNFFKNWLHSFLIRTSANLILLWVKMNLKMFHKVPILNVRTVSISPTTLLCLKLKHVDYIKFITQKFIEKRFFPSLSCRKRKIPYVINRAKF